MQQNAAFCVLLEKKRPPTAFSLSRVGMYGCLGTASGLQRVQGRALVGARGSFAPGSSWALSI